MRINELKIQGFKSFANKTSIVFDDNFVGIVGPNGSGKSNIIDAIRWVFGEQSTKSLRGNTSTDVIFNGTEKRKKQNFAEVTLVLDNTDNYLPLDYNEIAITRRLYRSGDSEYLINGINCRLKDITELMMDSGMGKSSFSIISQGKIEEIVVSKPEKRRELVEEVAGISKYKKRKEVAMRKLSKAEANISQVDLILNEMQLQIGPLEKQAQKATQYLKLKADLENYEVSYLANKINFSKEDYYEFKGICEEYEQNIIKMNTLITSLSTEQLELEQMTRDKSIELNQVQILITKIQKEITNLEVDYKIVQANKLTTTSDVKDIEIIKLQQSIANLAAQIASEQILLNSFQFEFTNISEEYNKCQEKINFIRQQKFDLSNKLTNVIADLENNSYPYAVKKVISNIEFDKAVVVKDIFDVDEKYLLAISSALGGRINEIIMPNISTIKRAIKYLKDTSNGRATFIPINDVRQYNVDSKIIQICKKNPGFIGFGYDLIKFDEKYTYVFNNLLKTTIIVNNIDEANILSKAINNRYRIITLSGDVVSTGGTITGGYVKKINTMLANKNKQDYEKELKNLESIFSNLVVTIQELEKTYQSKRLDVENKSQLISQLESNKKLQEYQLKDLTPSNDIVPELNNINLEKDLAHLRNQLSEQTINQQDIKFVYDAMLEKQQDINYQLRENNESVRIAEKKLNEYKIKMSRLEVTLDMCLKTLSEEYSYTFERAYEKSEKNIDLDLYELEVNKIKGKIKTLGIVNLDSIEEYNKVKERFDFMDKQKKDLNLAVDKLMEIINKFDYIVIEQFESVYTKLRSEFQLIFKELFGGGTADLILTTPNDLLITGVEIVAQPPGKKLQTISLLSGGEKALTAIALLFSILRIRTVPFAILDEVEAALDEANVKRYANYIKTFSEKTQFLVITHRQGTMELVDNLYGITMAERGISSVVSVKMSEVDKDVKQI